MKRKASFKSLARKSFRADNRLYTAVAKTGLKRLGPVFTAGGMPMTGSALSGGSKLIKYPKEKGRIRIKSAPPPKRITSGKRRGKGYSGSAQLGGMIGKGKVYDKTVKVDGKYTTFGIEKYGVILATEHRTEVSKPDSEGLMIGHTSLPGKFASAQMWRAIIKYVLTKMQCNVKDYGNAMSLYDFREGDRFSLSYYNNATDIIPTSFTVTIPAASCTFDHVAEQFYLHFTGSLALFDKRLNYISFLPVNTIAIDDTVARWGMIVLPLNTAKIAVSTKSILKVQNVTVETNADNEEDDVTRVPLQGVQFHCKGNNIVRKANNEILPGLYTGSNEHTIYKAWTRSISDTVGVNGVGFYRGETVLGQVISDIDSTYYKTSEIPKPWEISNCKSSKKFYMAPGDIRTSVLSDVFEMSLQHYFQMLYTYAASFGVAIQYNPKQGRVNGLYLEKVVGKKSTADNNIKLWTETEFRQSALVFDNQRVRTLPITYQENKDTVTS